jgi:4-hydroxybutyrate CoA-transferase
VHVSQIDYFVDHPHTGRKPGEVSLAGGKLEEPTGTQTQITSHVATLIKDGDTVQVGQGGTTEALIRCGLLDGKQDIGWHSEVTPGGIIRLVREGAVTGACKPVDRGKAVATAIGGGTVEEMSFVNLNPLFELRDIEYTHDPRLISQFDDIISINNALEVDLTGQINAEARGPRIFSGAGGLLAFTIGVHLARNGRSVIVLPATAVRGTVSRIVPMLESKVTVPHTLADYVVTEYGIAELRGKTVRERCAELTAIAHPDFRTELEKAARRLYWPS